MGIVHGIQTLRETKEKIVSRSAPLCDVTVTKYTVVPMENFF